ncbi:vegetative incompatibility protein HET-E-1 [Paraphaeosphaeria sporulosa]
MSGAEAITAIQLIDACIGIANTIIDIGRAVHDAQGLPPKLRDLLEKLPAIQELLENVSVSTATEPVQRSDWEASFRKSVWFTRGWTLQELIAPPSVEFFSCEGQPIGDKASLDQLIHKITGIPLTALHNCPLDQFTTSERERWAENRRITEEEDILYYLLGILGVYMRTAYGEG